MNTLVIDASTQTELVAVGAPKGTFTFSKPVGVSHSVSLFDTMDTLFAEAGISIQEIELIGTGIGPGSFTGVRIAVTTARMMAQVLNVPLAGVTSTELYGASACSIPEQTVIIAFDAKKGRVFGASYRTKETGRPQCLLPPGDYVIEDLVQNTAMSGSLYFGGDGAARYLERIKAVTADFSFIEDLNPDGDRAVEIIQAVYGENPKQYQDPARTLPFYGRKSDAEIMKEIREKGKGGPTSP